jgi:ABC-type branched-subunit amino acid transport system substrate-binding protein
VQYLKYMGWSNIGLISSDDVNFAAGADNLNTILLNNGFSIVSFVKYVAGQNISMASTLKAMKNTGVRVIILYTLTSEAALFHGAVKAAEMMGDPYVWVSPLATILDQWDKIKSWPNFVYVRQRFDATPQSTAFPAFFKYARATNPTRYRDDGDDTLDYWASFVFDNIMMVAAALHNAPSSAGADIKTALLSQGKDFATAFRGVTGVTLFGSDQDRVAFNDILSPIDGDPFYVLGVYRGVDVPFQAVNNKTWDNGVVLPGDGRGPCAATTGLSGMLLGGGFAKEMKFGEVIFGFVTV